MDYDWIPLMAKKILPIEKVTEFWLVLAVKYSYSVSFIVRNFRDWDELRNLRLRALEDSPEWFAAKFEVESARPPEDWNMELKTAHWRVIADTNKTVGMMAVSIADPLRDADCWLFGCWIAPEFRGQGLMNLIIDELDQICRKEGWFKQGLGVWPNNERAIRAYKKHGFCQIGDTRPSRIRPEQLYIPMFRSLPKPEWYRDLKGQFLRNINNVTIAAIEC